MRNNEHKLQVAIVRFLRLNRFFVFAVPNGGNRDAKTGAYLKDEGVMAGVSDLIIMHDGRIVFVEVKTDTGRQKPTQVAFQQAVEAEGHEYLIWRSVDDAISFVRDHTDAKRLNWGGYIAKNGQDLTNPK